MNLWKVTVELNELEREKHAPNHSSPTSLVVIVASITPSMARQLVQQLNIVDIQDRIKDSILPQAAFFNTKQIGYSTSNKAEVILFGFNS